MTNGNCISCVDGYNFLNGDCTKKVIEQVPLQTTTNIQHAGGAVVISTTTNTQGSSFLSGQTQTSTQNQTTTLNTPSTSTVSKDSNCLKSESGKCTQCSNRYYLSQDEICVPVNPLCENYNPNGACTSCYKGYTILGDLCIAAQQKDPYCR